MRVGERVGERGGEVQCEGGGEGGRKGGEDVLCEGGGQGGREEKGEGESVTGHPVPTMSSCWEGAVACEDLLGPR